MVHVTIERIESMRTFDLIKTVNGFRPRLKRGGRIEVFEKDELKSRSAPVNSIADISPTNNKNKNIQNISDIVKPIRSNSKHMKDISITGESYVEIVQTIKESTDPLIPLDLWMK